MSDVVVVVVAVAVVVATDVKLVGHELPDAVDDVLL